MVSKSDDKTTAADVLTQIRERLLSYGGEVNLLVLLGDIVRLTEIPDADADRVMGVARKRRDESKNREREALGGVALLDDRDHFFDALGVRARRPGVSETMVWSAWAGAGDPDLGQLVGQPVSIEPGAEAKLEVVWPFPKIPPEEVVIHDPVFAAAVVVVGLEHSHAVGPLPGSIFSGTTGPVRSEDGLPLLLGLSSGNLRVAIVFRNISTEPVRVEPRAFDLRSRRGFAAFFAGFFEVGT